jgi:Zn-dependent M28 family amino/carboxypeptidase
MMTLMADAGMLFRTYRHRVFRYLYRTAGEVDTAHDLTQDVFLREEVVAVELPRLGGNASGAFANETFSVTMHRTVFVDGYDRCMSSLRFTPLALAALVAVPVVAQGPSPIGDEQTRWWTHVKTLADDSFEGRQTGSDGYRKAAAYVAEQFERAGLKPAGTKGYFQPVQFTRRRIVEAQSQVAVVRGGQEDLLRFGEDITITLRAELTPSVEAPMVFAGYGISAPEAGHDDLANLDLKGKVAVYITGTPSNITGAPAAHYQNASIRWAAFKAAGALGALSIPNPKITEQPWERTAASRLNPVMTLVDPRFNDLAGMKVNANVHSASAERLFAGSGHTFADLLAIATARKPLPTFALPATLRARVTLESTAIESDNVVALLPGSDSTLASEHVVLTAHLDHVGIGAAVNGDRIYNGAMDNASGIATLIEVARQMGVAASRPKRSILFVAVTAEEHGLLGSRYFAGDPTVPKSSIVANINMDMFLPLSPMKSVMVLGLDESDLGDRIREVAARSGLAVGADPEPERNRFTRSDQYSFIRQGVPALAMKVGFEPGSPEAALDARWTRERYHQPSDDLQQPIDLGAAVAFTRLVGALSAEVANNPARPQWKATSFFKRFEPVTGSR